MCDCFPRFVISLSGKVFLHEGGAPGSWQDVTQLRRMQLGQFPWRFLRSEALDGVTDIILADGGFIRVNPIFDRHCLCPPQNFAADSPEAAQYTVHRHFRTISENVPGAIKNMFSVIDSPPKVGFRAAPKIHKAAVFLYNFLKTREGFLGADRYDWMV